MIFDAEFDDDEFGIDMEETDINDSLLDLTDAVVDHPNLLDMGSGDAALNQPGHSVVLPPQVNPENVAALDLKVKKLLEEREQTEEDLETMRYQIKDMQSQIPKSRRHRAAQDSPGLELNLGDGPKINLFKAGQLSLSDCLETCIMSSEAVLLHTTQPSTVA